ncbi:hypothetical protein [Microbacterium capsulatum]|uniref:Uncharacterized protein n=1 Tax=Microbacterium capsulatum TaxID=3041921 RepID=A0ABU0XER9_9MICO|nr:hypothetical protein [Microbacterium sp. ASV81]MDQ4212685.1 hypothetical protein [Microbacterium sp. ASV81]
MTQHSTVAAFAAAHRTVRALADGEGPFAGELVTVGDGVCVRADAAGLAGWPGWRFAGAEHVAGPRDLALREDGQDVLLPWCVRTGDAFLAQSTAAGPIANGEAVTLTVSVLRGLAELGDDPDLTGRWWLTDEARPMFVLGAGETPLDASARLLRALEERTEDRALSRLLARLVAAFDEPRRLQAEAERWERELLEIAAPRPLHVPDEMDQVAALQVAEPLRRADRALRRRDLRGARRVALPRVRSLPPSGPPWWARIDRLLAALATLRVAGPSAAARVARPPAVTTRKRWTGPAIVAVTAAAVIAVAGALWPSGTATPPADALERGASATAEPARPKPAPTPGGSESASPDPAAAPMPPSQSDAARTPGASKQQDPLKAAAELIASARTCEGGHAPGCDRVWDGGSSAVRPVRGAGAAPTLIEDYGDIAAVRTTGEDRAQMIVIIRRDDGWRIRDVYDIADPPSGGAGAPAS